MSVLIERRYALPPDYNARAEKEKIRVEKERERMEEKVKAQFPGMVPGMMPGIGRALLCSHRDGYGFELMM